MALCTLRGGMGVWRSAEMEAFSKFTARTQNKVVLQPIPYSLCPIPYSLFPSHQIFDELQ